MRFGVYSFCHAVISSRFFSFDIFPTWKCQFYVFIIWDEDFLSEAEKPAWSKRHMEIKPFPKWVLRRSHAI